MRSNVFDRLSFSSLFLVIVLLPFFFLPFTNIPVETSKGLLLVLGLVACVVFWSLARFFEGKISLPKSACLLSGGGVVLVFFLSAFFSEASQVSFFGTMFDLGSFWFIFAGFLLMSMSAIIFKDPKSARIVLFGAILSSAIVLVFQGARFLMPDVLSLGIFAEKTDNVLGSWNAFGLFAGFSCMISFLVIEFFPTTKKERLLFQALIVLSLILIATVNFPLVWGLLGVFSLVIFIYKISTAFNEKTKREKTHFPIFSSVIITVALLFFIFGKFFGGILPNRLGLTNNEVSPSFSATVSVTREVLKDNLILGTGPNRFGEAWANYKPAGTNGTQFWDVPFNFGSGLLPTLVSTTGYLGILAWLTFLILFIVSGVKSIFSSIKSGVNWETMAFFILSLYFFVASFFYYSGTVIFLLALAFAGVFMGLSASNSSSEISISFLNNHRKSFFSILFIVLVIITSIITSFKYIERFISVSYFRKALTTTSILVAETSIDKALKLYSNDLYLRTYAQIYLVKLNSLVTKKTPLSNADEANLQVNLDQAVSGAQLATLYNPTNYLNFRILGSVYRTATILGVKEAYERAIEAYKTAATLNPLNPGIKLDMASVSFTDGKVEEAKSYARDVLFLKPDYVDGLVFLSQIAKSENNIKDALSFAQTALAVTPANEDLIKYVNSLKNLISSSPTVGEEDNSTKKEQ